MPVYGSSEVIPQVGLDHTRSDARLGGIRRLAIGAATDPGRPGAWQSGLTLMYGEDPDQRGAPEFKIACHGVQHLKSSAQSRRDQLPTPPANPAPGIRRGCLRYSILTGIWLKRS